MLFDISLNILFKNKEFRGKEERKKERKREIENGRKKENERKASQYEQGKINTLLKKYQDNY